MQGLFLGWGVQLTLASVIHDSDKPGVQANLVFFSNKFGHLLYPLAFSLIKNKTKIYKVTTSLFGLMVWGTINTAPKLGASCLHCRLPPLICYAYGK